MTKLFIWTGDGVLEDYSSGMIVALAADHAGALVAIRKSCCGGFPHQPTEVIELGDVEVPDQAWYCWGGG